jgi:hypothetical protein
MMRYIKSTFFSSVDGVVEAPASWHFPYCDDQLGAVGGGPIADAGAVLREKLRPVTVRRWSAITTAPSR